MTKIIKIALIAAAIALVGCSADGNPSGPRITDTSVNNPAGNQPAAGLENLLKEVGSSYDDED